MKKLIILLAILTGGCATAPEPLPPAPVASTGFLYRESKSVATEVATVDLRSRPAAPIVVEPKVSNRQRRPGMLFGGNNIFRLSWPAQGWISSRFGPRRGRLHAGLDIAAPYGSAIRAAASGRVIYSGYARGYGRTVMIDHGKFTTLYAHCSRNKVRVGQRVKEGQVVALVGNSGRVRGTHLHFETRNAYNKPINPIKFLRSERLVSRL